MVTSTAASPPAPLLGALDEQQQIAVTAPAGPVCILAGAGTGKTRAITHRIAFRVLDTAVASTHVLAVTFTARAAGEMRGRLRELGVTGVSARTFHAAALRQLRYFAPRVLGGREMPRLVESKVKLVAQSASRAQVNVDRTTLRDVTSEIEWAKSTLVEPDDYPAMVAKISRPVPLTADVVASIYVAYEQEKRRIGVIDFEDLLRATAWAIEEHGDVAEQIRAQYRHFVVDEYQDVNPLQQRLLDAWLGGRRDLCVVGDASQTIYSFTGASASNLIDFPRRYSDATVVRLERDYRSTPQVVSVANDVIAAATGEQASLRLRLIGQRKPGPDPQFMSFSDEEAEARAVAKRCQELRRVGVPAAEIAVLYRTNAQAARFEQALSDASVPYVVQGAERFFERPEIAQALVLLRGAARSSSGGDSLATTVVDVLAALGFQPAEPPTGGAGRERWEALAALTRLAEDFAVAQPDAALPSFVEELAERAAAAHVPTIDGVTLASLHAAKGLEWDAVFLVGLCEGTLPISYATTPTAIEEERRLLYVGVTRAREHLWLSFAAARSASGRGGRRPSRFLPGLTRQRGRSANPAEPGAPRSPRARTIPTCRGCGVALFDPTQRKLRRCSGCPATYDEALYEALREWRAIIAKEQELPAYCIFTDATLRLIAEDLPADEAALAAISGIGPRKLALYGAPVLELITAHR